MGFSEVICSLVAGTDRSARHFQMLGLHERFEEVGGGGDSPVFSVIPTEVHIRGGWPFSYLDVYRILDFVSLFVSSE